MDVLGVGGAEGLELNAEHDPHALGKPTGQGEPLTVALDMFVVHGWSRFLCGRLGSVGQKAR